MWLRWNNQRKAEWAFHYDEHFDKVFLLSVYWNTYTGFFADNEQQEVPLFGFVVVGKQYNCVLGPLSEIESSFIFLLLEWYCLISGANFK